MTALDIGLVIGISFFVFFGMMRGLIKILLGFTGWILAVIVAVIFSSQLAPSIADALPNMKKISLVIAFIFLVVAVRIGCYIIVLLLKRLLNLDHKSGIDKLLGGLIGLAQGVILASFVSFGIAVLPLDKDMQTMQQQSTIHPQLIKFSAVLVENFSRIMPKSHKAVEDILQKYKKQNMEKLRNKMTKTVEKELQDLDPEDAAEIYEKEKERLEKLEKDLRRK